mgnify:CR=1 FL=1
MLRMSPSSSARSSGMPWHTHSFTDVHTDLGNLPVGGGRVGVVGVAGVAGAVGVVGGDPKGCGDPEGFG